LKIGFMAHLPMDDYPLFFFTAQTTFGLTLEIEEAENPQSIFSSSFKQRAITFTANASVAKASIDYGRYVKASTCLEKTPSSTIKLLGP